MNTLPGLAIRTDLRRGALGGGGGGLSGPALHAVALRAVADVAAALPEVPIIGVGGVMSGVGAVEFLLAGARAVQVGTATLLDPHAPARGARRAAPVVRARTGSTRLRISSEVPMAEAARRPAAACASDSLSRSTLPDLAVGDGARRGGLAPWFAVVKVGLELYVAEGPAAVAAFVADGFDVFVDLKLHDIPTTVARGPRGRSRAPARATRRSTPPGGAEMLAGAAAGFCRGAAEAGWTTPTIGLAITVLTSDAEAAPALVVEHAALAAAAPASAASSAPSAEVAVGARRRARDDHRRARDAAPRRRPGRSVAAPGRREDASRRRGRTPRHRARRDARRDPVAAARALVETLESAIAALTAARPTATVVASGAGVATRKPWSSRGAPR